MYRYNFRPLIYVGISCILAAITVYGSIEDFGMFVTCIHGAFLVIGVICHFAGFHIRSLKQGANSKAIRLNTNYFDYIFNVDNTYLLVPAPYGLLLVVGWSYVSLILWLANKANNDNWVHLCKDDDYDEPPFVENGSCLIRHSCFSTIMIFGGYSVGTAVILLPKVSASAQSRAVQAKVHLLSRFNNAQKYFDKVRENVHKRVKYIIDYRANFNTYICGERSLPWLAILTICLIIPISLGTLYVESHFYTKIESEHSFASKLIFWLSSPLTVMTIFGGFSVLWRLYNLYKINYLTMKSLRNAVIADSVVDLIEWWEVRKFYLFYAMPIRYTFGTYGFMYVFFLSTVLILAAFFMVVFYGQVWQYIFGQQGLYIRKIVV